MAFVMFRETGFSRERVIGMGGMLDSQRFRYFIAEELDISPRKVEAMVIGEHGDSMVPLVSQAKVNNKPLKELLKPDEIKKVVERTKNAGAEVIGLKGSAFYAPSAAVTLMAEAVVKNTKKLFPASVYLQGEYGAEGIFNGVPAKLGNSGLEEIVELDIGEEEKKAFLNSCDALKGKAKEIGLV
jgi:malate dehydrogenase